MIEKRMVYDLPTIYELLGISGWNQLVEWFADADIITELQNCWPDDDNEELAEAIEEFLARGNETYVFARKSNEKNSILPQVTFWQPIR